MATDSSHLDLYKSKNIHSHDYKQSERREQLLESHRSKRNQAVDSIRGIESIQNSFRRYNSKPLKCDIRVQESEWLYGIPDDIDNWYMKPCPKGYRALVVAMDGQTRTFNKHGVFARQFHSNLPGDSHNKHNQMTILDCIYVAHTKEYFVLDVIAYGGQDLSDCEADFRFYWIESRMNENDLTKITETNQCSFRLIDKYECSDDVRLNEFLMKYPVWLNNMPELDGFLFYHKHSSYIHGKTPLVGWLFAFMMPEYFHTPHINENYLKEKPSNYTNYLEYIKEFDKAQRNKKTQQKQNRNVRVEKMEAEPNWRVRDSASGSVENVAQFDEAQMKKWAPKQNRNGRVEKMEAEQNWRVRDNASDSVENVLKEVEELEIESVE